MTATETTTSEKTKTVKTGEAPVTANENKEITTKASKKRVKTKAKKQATKQTTNQCQTETKEDVMTQTTNTTNKQFDQFAQQAYQGFEQLTTFGKEMFDAWVQSSNFYATGTQELAKQTMQYSQEATDKALTSFKDLMTCRSLNEFTEKQSQIAQTNLNTGITNATDITEKYIKLCQDSAEPLNKKITNAVEKATKKAA